MGWMGGGGTTVAAPEADPNIGLAAMKSAELGEDYLQVAKDQFAVMMERQKGVDAIGERVTNAQLATQDTANKWAAEDRERYKSVYQPLENDYLQKTKNWDSAERQEKLGDEARASVINQAHIQKDGRAREMAAMGVDPTSGRYAGIERGADMQTALAAAGAQNNAANMVRNQALALQGDAINTGRGLPSQAQSALGLGVNSGSAAAGTNAQANAQARSAVGVLQSGYGTAMQGYGAQANILNNQYNSQLNAWSTQQQAAATSDAGLFGGLGTAAGMIGKAMMSSKELKEDKRPVEGALEAVNSMPIEEWKYKDGIEDGGHHIGPYAEDFKQATGKGDGKSIFPVDAIGVTMKAVQELSAQVKELAASQGKGRGRGKSIMRAAA